MKVNNETRCRSKKYPNAKPGDAGMDLYAVSESFDDHGNYVYGTGLAMEIPEGYGFNIPVLRSQKQHTLLEMLSESLTLVIVENYMKLILTPKLTSL